MKLTFDDYYHYFSDELERLNFDGQPCIDTCEIYFEEGVAYKKAAREFIKVQNKDIIEFVSKDTMNSGVEELKDSLLKTYKEKTFAVISRLDEIGIPKKNEQLRLVTKRSFNAIAFLKWIHSIEGTIKSAIFCIYSINHEAATFLNKMILDREILEVTILMSNLRNKAHRKKEQATKDFFIENPNVELIFASAHSKVMTFETEKGNFYTIEGSGNLSYNSRIEQYVIDNDKKIFDFTKNWILDIKNFLKGKKELTVYPKNGNL